MDIESVNQKVSMGPEIPCQFLDVFSKSIFNIVKMKALRILMHIFC